MSLPMDIKFWLNPDTNITFFKTSILLQPKFRWISHTVLPKFDPCLKLQPELSSIQLPTLLKYVQ